MMDITVKGLNFSYNRREAVLKDVSYIFKAGTVTAIFGPNGSGKTTLLRCLNGSLKPDCGEVFIGYDSISPLSKKQIAAKVAVVPQDTPADSPFSVRQTVIFGRFPHGSLLDGYSRDDEMIADAAICQMGISHLSERPFCCLSGGERQRTVLARALAQQCGIMLFDEPGTHLDISHQLELYKLMRKLADDGKTVILVCHDLFIAPMFTDNVVLLKNGKVASSGLRDDVLTQRNLVDVFDAAIDITRPDARSFLCSI